MSVAARWCLVLASTTAQSGTIEEEWPHAGTGSVTIDNAFGSVAVIGWAEPRVSLRGELGSLARLVVRSDSPTRLRLAVIVDNHASTVGGSRLVLHVPHSVALTVTGVSADVDVSGMRNAPMVAISTVSGDQRLDCNASASRLKSVSGDLDLRGASARSVVATISGDVELHDFVGGAEVSLVSGDLSIARSSFGVLDVDSVSGDLEISATPVRNARWRIESLGGNIDLRGLDRARVAVSADTFSGTIDSGFEPSHQVGREGSRNRGKSLRLEPAGAEARVAIDTFSGDIRLHQQR